MSVNVLYHVLPCGGFIDARVGRKKREGLKNRSIFVCLQCGANITLARLNEEVAQRKFPSSWILNPTEAIPPFE